MLLVCRVASTERRLESKPPDRKAPTGTSATMWAATESASTVCSSSTVGAGSSPDRSSFCGSHHVCSRWPRGVT